MSDQPAIRLQAVGKRYTLYPAPLDSACDALGLSWLLLGRRKRWRQFWALRNINLTLPRGARIGIVGRNGAGKSTLLKLITGNVDPTEGQIEVNGDVQALLQAGTGMHPEFTGRTNIEAALTYQGLSAAEIQKAIQDIIEFTELGPFLDQPFKTYSTGMQARLAFATATVVKPDILIVDELLGVGDGYFLSKSTERMRKLIESGATVLLVSHSMEQIVRFCSQAIWMDRGQIVRQGDALEVVKEYERYLRLLDERRLKAENAQRQGGIVNAGSEGESLNSESLSVRFRVTAGSVLSVGEIQLLENDRPQDRLHIGGPQDGDPSQSVRICSASMAAWSAPRFHDNRMYRDLIGGDNGTTGDVVFSLHFFDPSVTYAFEIQYALAGGKSVIEICHCDHILQSVELDPFSSWHQVRVACEANQSQIGQAADRDGQALKLVHWPGIGGLHIENVRLLDQDGNEQSVFEFGTGMTIEVCFRALQAGAYPVQPALTIYRRSDGVCVTQFIGRKDSMLMSAGEAATACLQLGPIQLGNDTYVIATSLFRTLDPMQIEQAERYDTIDRSIQFKVYGREPFRRGVFQQPGDWTIERSGETLPKSA